MSQPANFVVYLMLKYTADVFPLHTIPSALKVENNHKLNQA